MEKQGKYVYCIIGTKQERNFGPIGIGDRGDEVLTIGYDDLSMVVSNHPIGRLIVNLENMLGHEKVIEKVMIEFDSVLPVRFGTIASSADEIRNVLGRRYREFRNVLKDMDHKIELGVKGLWKNGNDIFKEILEGSKDISRAKKEIQKNKTKNTIGAQMELGREVQQALAGKKEREADRIVEALRRSAYDYKLNRTIGDEMFMNAAFLVDKGREKEFDNIMDDLSEQHKDRIRFMYAGPLPVFNFVNITIYPEEWEK